jgi:hypothetical protein
MRCRGLDLYHPQKPFFLFSLYLNKEKLFILRKEPDKLIRLVSIEVSSSAGSVFMPITIGVLFRRIVKDLQTQDNNLDSYLNDSNSDINNPNYDINNPNSAINNQYSCLNDASNTEKNKEIRREALSDLIKMYLSDYVSEEQAKKLVEEYVP